MRVIKNDDGEDEEVYTKEELEEMAEEKLAGIKEANLTLESELKAREAALRDTEEQLAKLKDKDFNFEKLRKKVEEPKSKQAAVPDELVARLDNLSKELESIKSQPLSKLKEDFIKLNEIDGDEGLKNRFTQFAEKFTSGVTDEKEFKASLAAALTAATEGAVKPRTDFSMLSVRPVETRVQSRQPSEAVLEMRRAMGITEEDVKKYGGK